MSRARWRRLPAARCRLVPGAAAFLLGVAASAWAGAAASGAPGAGAVREQSAIAPRAAGPPKAPDRFRIDRVFATRIELRWKDRAEDERHDEVRYRRRDGTAGWRAERLPRDSESFRSRRLARGKVYEHQARACNRRGCSPWSRLRRQATLLRPFGDPYPGLGSCPVFPESSAAPADPSAGEASAWNQDISQAPLDPSSDAYIDRIRALGGNQELHPDFGENPDYGLPYVVVPGEQPDVPIEFTDYGDESDPGPYPVPPRSPIETGSDHHLLALDRGHCMLYELFAAEYRDGGRNRWAVGSGAVFDLTSTGLRPDTLTSADAAGLPIFPGLVRYDEVAAGEIDHAIRITFEETRRAFIHPATHYASCDTDPDLPPMGLRLRLRSNYETAALSPQARVIARALKRYGAFVADNGGSWFISGATDSRWDDEQLNQLKAIGPDEFEVVRSEAPVRAGEPC